MTTSSLHSTKDAKFFLFFWQNMFFSGNIELKKLESKSMFAVYNIF